MSVVAAEDDDRAQWLAGPIRLKVLSRARGRRILLPSPEDAAAHPFPDGDAAPGVLTGGPAAVAERLQAVVDETGADEVMVTTPVHHHADRLRSYELVASVAHRLRRVTPGP